MTSANELVFRFELPKKDQVRASRYITNRQWGTWLAYAFFGGCGAYVLALTISSASRGARVHWPSTTIAVAGCLAMVGFIYCLPNYTVRRMRKDLPIHQGPHEWILTPGSGVATASPQTSSVFAWSLFKKVVESDAYFLFYLTKSSALVLPKRAVGSGDADLRAMLWAELGARARLRTGAVQQGYLDSSVKNGSD